MRYVNISVVFIFVFEFIGDGPHFIGSLLRKLCKLDEKNVEEINRVRNTLWPKQRERQAEQRVREQKEREERTRRARERQRILMQDFAHRQNAFMKKAMETGKIILNYRFMWFFSY